MDKIVIKNSRRETFLLFLVSLGFVTAGVAMIATGSWFGWVATAFFGACGLVFLRELLRINPRLIIDERGIYDSRLGLGRIKWRDIRYFYLTSISHNNFLCLVLADEEKYRRRLSPTRQAMANINRKLGVSDFTVNLSTIQAQPEEVYELVIKYCAYERLRRIEHSIQNN